MILSSLYPDISCAFYAHCPVHQNHQQNGLVLEICSFSKPFIVYIVDHLSRWPGKNSLLGDWHGKERICLLRGMYAHIYDALLVDHDERSVLQ